MNGNTSDIQWNKKALEHWLYVDAFKRITFDPRVIRKLVLVQYKMREGYKKADGNFPRVGHNKAKLTNPTYKILYDALQYNYFERRGRSSYDYNFHSDFNKLQITNYNIIETYGDDSR